MLTSDSYAPILLAGLSHPDEAVRETVVGLLGHWRHKSYLLSSPFFDGVILCVRDPSLSVANEAMNLVLQLATSSREGLARLVSAHSVLCPPEAEELLYDLRGLELSLKAASTNPEAWQAFQEVGLLASWEALLSHEELLEDPLLLLNHLECGQQLLEGRLGFEELVERNILEKVLALATPNHEICFCGIFSFVESFANAAHQLQWRGWPQVQLLKPLLEACLDMEDSVLQRAAINAIGTIGCSVAGLQSVGELLPKITRFLWVCDQELQIATLRALAAVLANGVDEADPTLQLAWASVGEAAERTHGVTSSIAAIHRLAKLPFDDISTAALQLLLGLAHRPWGLLLEVNEPGFLDFVVDPRAASRSPALKVELARKLLDVPGLDSGVELQLQHMVACGGPLVIHASPATEAS